MEIVRIKYDGWGLAVVSATFWGVGGAAGTALLELSA